MAIFTLQCPHCRTESIALEVIAGVTIKEVNELTVIAGAYLQCPKCRKPCCVEARRRFSDAWEPEDWHQERTDLFNLGWECATIWPQPMEPRIPESLPPHIERMYKQAERNFAIEGNEEAAGMMYRKALDVGLKVIDPETKGNLSERIKKLAAQHRLTPDIADWADQIRDLGNGAAHDAEPPTRKELADLRNFTDMVMRYLFSLPALVADRRAAIDAPALKVPKFKTRMPKQS